MSDQKRGRCQVCDRDMLLKKDGTLRHHGGPVGSGMWSDYRSYQCKGAGAYPVGAGPQVDQRYEYDGDTYVVTSVDLRTIVLRSDISIRYVPIPMPTAATLINP